MVPDAGYVPRTPLRVLDTRDPALGGIGFTEWDVGLQSEVPAGKLDDQQDRAELRERYYGLLQELRVLLPGVQVLVAFMLAVPFAQRFSALDPAATAVFGSALVASVLSVVSLMTPISLHRSELAPRGATASI